MICKHESYACHYPTRSGNPEKQFKTLDSRLRGNDREWEDFLMSVHGSLKSHQAYKKRNVLKKYERVKVLKSEKKWEDGDSIYGLPKVKPSE